MIDFPNSMKNVIELFEIPGHLFPMAVTATDADQFRSEYPDAKKLGGFAIKWIPEAGHG